MRAVPEIKDPAAAFAFLALLETTKSLDGILFHAIDVIISFLFTLFIKMCLLVDKLKPYNTEQAVGAINITGGDQNDNKKESRV